MKYISRLTALLLAVMLGLSSASALTIDDLTRGAMDALYNNVSGDAYTTLEAGVLGESLDLEAFATVTDKQHYTYQWYDKNGGMVESTEEPYVLHVTVSMEEQQFYCVATDATNNSYKSDIFVIPAAQTTDMEAYVGYLANYAFDDDLGLFNKALVYSYLMDIWNVTIGETTLGANVVSEWWTNWSESELYFDMMCSCVVSGKVAADACVLHPDAAHDVDCEWYNGSPVLELQEETDAEGNICYVLFMTDDEGERVIIATTEMLDGVHHYFKDAKNGLFVAWLYTDEEGVQWIMPLKSETELPEEEPAN